MSLGVFIGLRVGIDMKLFPSNPAEGTPSYLDEVRSPDKRLRMRYFAGPSGGATGFYPVAVSYDASSSTGADNGLYFEQLTGTISGNDAGVRIAVFEEIPPFADSLYIVKFRIMDNTDIRAFVGWTTESYTEINDNDTIGGDAVGFQFSSSRGDTNWQLITNDFGMAQTTTDSGLAFSTNQIYIVEMEFTSLGESVRFRISDENFNVLMNDTIVTSNLPTASSDVSPSFGIQTLTTAAKTSRFYWQEVWY